MAIITVTSVSGDGQRLERRINSDQIVTYAAVPAGTHLVMTAGVELWLEESVDEVDELIAKWAYTFFCEDCGTRTPETRRAPNDNGAVLCSDCWTLRDRARLNRTVREMA
jgi:uncharacterized protein YlzI (FlbEa/FlbD family)